MPHAGWRCEGVKVLPLLMVFPARCISSVSPRFYFREHAFCFLPLVTILEFTLLWLFFKQGLLFMYRQTWMLILLFMLPVQLG
jgi:hypothetical protein